MKKHFFFLLSVSIGLLACNNTGHVESAETVVQKRPESHFAAIDSIEVIYYPNIQDQKDFKAFFVADTAFINMVKMNLAQAAEPRKEGAHHLKMYLFDEGNVFKTLYAAVTDSNSYLAYAINGQPQFIPLQTELRQALDSLVKSIQ